MSLQADCERCFGLCCVAPAFAKSADFAIAKGPGEPCPNLQPDFGCAIHAGLREHGFSGCAAYDCFGAGQKVAQDTFRGQDWRSAPHLAGQMFEVFTIMRQLHELLWYLSEALRLVRDGELHDELGRHQGATLDVTMQRPDALTAFDVSAHRDAVKVSLRRASERFRGHISRRADYRGADLIGTRLRGTDLRGADLSGASLIGADLSGSDLRHADVIGADCRSADLSGADLSSAIFLTQSQIDSARGDAATAFPVALSRPAHWAA